jgi:hypothetical protein
MVAKASILIRLWLVKFYKKKTKSPCNKTMNKNNNLIKNKIHSLYRESINLNGHIHFNNFWQMILFIVTFVLIKK